MRRHILIASAAVVALAAPALAKDHGDKGGHGDKHSEQRGDRGRGDDGDGDRGRERGNRHVEVIHTQQVNRGDWRGERHDNRAERRWAENDDSKAWRKRAKAEEKFERRAFKADEKFAKRIAKEDRKYAHAYERAYRYRESRYSPTWLAQRQQRTVYYGVGQAIPASYYGAYNVPVQYRDFYSDNDASYYRYDQGNIYQVDRSSNMISSLIPLLGGAFGVGQVLPAGFDAYNLPMQYRDQYQDSSDAYYRYGDDAIYQVDPKTRMIEGVVALLTGDMNVGQMLPAGYDAYNLPLQYRDQYPDTADQMYRYGDGNIYGIDPKTQMIQTVISLLT